MAFFIGQKVVRVAPSLYLEQGQVYEIVGFAPVVNKSLPPGLILKGHEPNRRRDGSLRGWNPVRFRPVVERKTDISIFTAMLDPTRVSEVV